MLIAGLGASPAAAQAGCDPAIYDPSYPDVCIGYAWSIGDLNCKDLGSMVRVVHDATIGAYDSHGFDADYDALGCESYG
jgi:hypothetical protein